MVRPQDPGPGGRHLRRRRPQRQDPMYLWCAVNLLLDDEETLEQLCPACRERALEARCPVCGAPTGGDQVGENPAFDQERFEQLRRGVIT